jgi:xanthine dehydrogenase YagR molybdenum-binding subunit
MPDKKDRPEAAPTEEKPVPQAALKEEKVVQKPASAPQLFPVGIVGSEMDEAQRKTPADEPPPLPINEKLKVIGKPIPRLDGRLKVTGAARYTADVRLPGMLHARLITSSVPHARITSIDTSSAERAPGVKAIHLLDRDRDAAQTKEDAQHKYPKVRYAGQPLGAIAAISEAAAEDALRLVKIEYEQESFVVDAPGAMKAGAPLIFAAPAEQEGTAGGGGGARNVQQQGNVRGPVVQGAEHKEKLEQVFAESDVVVDLEFRTQVQTHSALETHGVVADWRADGLTVYASTQGTASVRDELAAVFDLKKSQVRVITEFMGGGFGAKFGAGNYGVLATHLARKAKAPVRLMLTREEEHLCVGNRPDSFQRLRIGAKQDGSLNAMHLVNFGTGGVGTGAGASGPARSMYSCPVIVTEDSDVFTNAGPAAAFRAPGHPQGAFALEQTIDELAHKLQMDPLDLREKIDTSDARRVERRIGAERIGWKDRHPPGADPGPIKRGMGFAQSIWYRFMNRDSHCEVRLTQDGSVELLSGVQDIGTGIRTALAQCVAEELGLKPTDITVKIGDTAWPQGPSSGGSVTTNSITPVARNAAYRVKLQLLEVAAPLLGVAADELVLVDGKIHARSDSSKSMDFRAACRKLTTEQIAVRASRSDDYGIPDEANAGRRRGSGQLGGVQFAQVVVDTETGIIKVERIVAVHDCGRPINPMGVDSQVYGGVIQGISYALYEDRILDRNTGLMVNPNLEQYKIVGVRETPQIESILIEQYWGRSSTDAAGIGEPATVPTAAAIANAVFNATSVRVRQLPMTPAVVLRALAAANERSVRQ